MLPQRLRWLLPALFVSWTNLQLAAASPAHDERNSHAPASTFDPSVATTSTMIRQDYNKRAHPPHGKNDTQPSQKLVASPAGLLRPDKFQFYTYNDKGDMITRQMTVQEIQGLIAAGGADHVAMDKQEPQKADDMLTGGKKVMDVVQKVQNVLKSALDKPPTLTGTMTKIPEHANVEWSNILPSILSGEVDAISSSGESNQSLYKLTTEAGSSGAAEYASSVVASASNVGTNASDAKRKKPAVQSDVQTNAYAGFANNNNMGHGEKPQYGHHSHKKPATGAFTEKPMIPVPVITVTGQKLSTLQSAVTESPIFQMLSVIPVEAAESAHGGQEHAAASYVTTELSAQTVAGQTRNQTGQFVELILSKAPEDSTTTATRLTGSSTYPANVTKQTSASLVNKVGQGMEIPAVTYSMTAPTAPPTVDVKQTAAYGKPGGGATNRIESTSSANYVLLQNKDNTRPLEDNSYAASVTKDSWVSVTHGGQKITSQTNVATSTPLFHAASVAPPKPEATSNVVASRWPPSTPVSRPAISAASTLPHASRPGAAPSTHTDKLPTGNSVTPTYAANHRVPQPIQSQSSPLMEPLPTQLIDSFSSVISQISEAIPSVLSLSTVSDRIPEIPIVSANYDQRRNVSGDGSTKTTIANTAAASQYVTLRQTYTTVTARSPPQNVATRTTARTSHSTTTKRSNDVPASPSALTTTIVAASNRVTIDDSATMSSGPGVDRSESSDATISQLNTTPFSPVWVQLERVHDASSERPHAEATSATPAAVAAVTASVASATSEKHAVNATVASLEKTSPDLASTTTTIRDATKAQSTSASIGATSAASNKPTPADGYLHNTLMNINWNDPVSAIDQVLNIAPLPSSTPSLKPISLPNDTSNLVASDLASGLIAGFPASTSEKSSLEEVPGKSQITKSTLSVRIVRPTVSSDVTKLAESVGNVNQMHQGSAGLGASDYQKRSNVTHTSQTSTSQGVSSAGSVKNGTLALNVQTKNSNKTCLFANISDDHERATNGNCESSTASSGEDALTKESIKLPNSNERVSNFTKTPLPSSPNKFANASDEFEKSAVQSSASAGFTVTVNPERLSTTNVHVQSSISNKTHASYNQNKKDDREKMKTTTKAPTIGTKVTPASSRPLATVNALVGSANGSDTKNVKTEASNQKNNSFSSNSSSTTQRVDGLQQQNLLAADSANNSHSALHSSLHEHRNSLTTVSPAANITSGTATSSNENFTASAASQNPNRDGNATTFNNDEVATTSSYAAANNYTTSVAFETIVQNGKDDYDAVSSSSSVSLSSSPVNGANYSNSDATGQNDKNALPQRTTAQNDSSSSGVVFEESSTKSASSSSIQTASGQSSNTESKPASSKHSESPAKPDEMRVQLSTPSLSPTVRPTPKPAINNKPSEKFNVSKTDADVNAEDKWTLISQQTSPAVAKFPKPPKPSKPLRKPGGNNVQASSPDENANIRTPGGEVMPAHQQHDPFQGQSVLPLDASQSASGLDVTVKHTNPDIVNFAKLCNELAFNFWVATNKGLSTARSLALSPFGMTSLLAMIFLGARGPTSDQMNEVLGLDDVATFNPHLVFQNITDTVSLARGQGIANAAFVRELFADKMKVRKLMPFYKEQAQQFYEGLVAEVNFATISDLVRRRTNLLIRKQTGGRIKDFVKTNTVPLRSPLAALSANVFQTDCNTTLTSSIGRDGELYFAVSPAVRQRRLVPVPATTWRSGVLAGYEPSVDATVVALGGGDRLVSTIFLLPGQQGHTAPGDTLDRLEQRLVRSAFRDGTWTKLLKVLIPRSGLELQVPKFSHRSVINATAALKRMGLDELFSGNADFKGINGIGHRLHLADVLQMNLFSTCGDENILSGRHHVETYPASPLRSIRRRIGDASDFGSIAEDDTMTRYSGVLSREDHISSFRADRSRADRFRRKKRQMTATLERPRLKLDRPFLYFVRHNPSGIILHMGRFNPRLLP